MILTDENLRAVIDACALANARVTEVLLSLAKYEDSFEPKWTETILDEMQRAQVGFGWLAEHAENYRGAMSARFRRAEVRGYEHWISQCTNHEGDRHVLAAAIEAKVRVVVTFNTVHFKHHDLDPCGVSEPWLQTITYSDFTSGKQKLFGDRLSGLRRSEVAQCTDSL